MGRRQQLGARGVGASWRPPGPVGGRWVGWVAEYEKDRLGFLMSARESYGGVVAFDSITTGVNDLELARTVLDTRAGFEIVGTFLNRRLDADGIAARNRLRKHLNAGLRGGVLEPLRGLASEASLGAVEAARDRGEDVDPLPMLEELCSRLVAGYFFGEESSGRVHVAVAGLLEALSAVFGNPFALPSGWPTRANRRMHRAYRALRDVVDPLVCDRAGRPRQDFASGTVVAAVAAGHTLESIADLLIGALLAAQRVPAAAAAWALHELGRDRRWAAAARGDAVRRRAVVLETLRLYPPTWRLHRVAIRPVELGRYRFEAGHNFVVSPYVVHRDAALFDRPDEFLPERWLDPDSRPQQLLSFGHGLHRCPGRDVSYVLLDAVLAAVLRGYDVENVSDRVVPDPRTTLTPAGLRLRFAPRRGEQAGPRAHRTGLDLLDASGATRSSVLPLLATG